MPNDASISWTDSTGAATLHNGKPIRRFSSWEPTSPHVGQKVALLATGARRAWTYREQYGARFTMEHIPNADMALMLRLAKHLDGGGTASVATGDASDTTYATCGLAPGAEPPWPTLTDRAALEYAMAFDVIDLAGSPAPMLCLY